MAKRQSKKVVTGVTEEQFQEAMSIYAQKDAEVDKQTAKMNGEITRVREKYDAAITAARDEMDRTQEIIQAFCMENKSVLFSDKRHLDTVHGKVGFRLGTPALKTLPKWTWAKVLDKIETVLPEFVRTKKEIDKEGILSNRAEAAVAPHLNEIGVYVEQSDSFYIELKKEVAVPA
jgi:phage host-nuclease inhibitor protein Gam